MGLWVSKLGDGSDIPTLVEDLVVSHVHLSPEEELEKSVGGKEAYVSVNIPETEAATAPILRYPEHAVGGLSDSGGPEFEMRSVKQDEKDHPTISSSQSIVQRSQQRLEMSNHMAPISSSHAAMQRSGQRLEVSNYSAAGSGSPTALQQQDIGDVQQRNEQLRNISRDSPLSPEDESHEKELKSGKNFAYWSGSISFTGVMGVIGARVGNLAVKRLPLYACSASTCSAFIISMLLLIFTTICPPATNSTRTIKGTQCLIVGLVSLAVGFGFAMIF